MIRDQCEEGEESKGSVVSTSPNMSMFCQQMSHDRICFCTILAGEDEITFDPGDIIDNIEEVSIHQNVIVYVCMCVCLKCVCVDFIL